MLDRTQNWNVWGLYVLHILWMETGYGRFVWKQRWLRHRESDKCHKLVVH